jgi:tetratricopeptide (TPR) repeat protein
LKHVKDVKLWALPFVVEKQRKEFESLISQYLFSQTMPFMLTSEAGMPLWRGRILHLRGDLLGEEGAAHYYQLARPPERLIDSGELTGEQQMMFTIAKLHAAYWLGLIAVQQGNRKSAEDYLINRTAMVLPDQPWQPGVLYALGRLNERLGDYSRAITAFRSELELPNRFGNLVRARFIEDLTGAKPLELTPKADQNKAEAKTPD